MPRDKSPPKPKKPDPDQGARFKRFALEHGATDADALDKALGEIKSTPGGTKPPK